MWTKNKKCDAVSPEGKRCEKRHDDWVSFGDDDPGENEHLFYHKLQTIDPVGRPVLKEVKVYF